MAGLLLSTLGPFSKRRYQTGLHTIVNLSGWRLWLSLECTMFCLCSLGCQTLPELDRHRRNIQFAAILIFNCAKPKGETENGWVFFSHVITFSGEEDYESLTPGCDSLSGLQSEIPPPSKRCSDRVPLYALSSSQPSACSTHYNMSVKMPPDTDHLPSVPCHFLLIPAVW